MSELSEERGEKMRDQFYLHFDTMPKATSQQKGVRVVNGKPHFYEKSSVDLARREFTLALKPHRPKSPAEGPVKLTIWFAFDIKDKKLWGQPKPTRPDTDNYLKLFKDCMTDCGFWLDDAQVVDERVYKTYAEKATIMVSWSEIREVEIYGKP